MSSSDQTEPPPATSLVYGVFPDGSRSFFFAGIIGHSETYRFFVGNAHKLFNGSEREATTHISLERKTRKVEYEPDGLGGLTITWGVVGNQDVLSIPATGEKVSLNGEEFKVVRYILDKLPLHVVSILLGRVQPK